MSINGKYVIIFQIKRIKKKILLQLSENSVKEGISIDNYRKKGENIRKGTG